MVATLKIYDPLKAVKRMEKAGVKKELAESIATEIKESQENLVGDLATKDELKAEINSLRKDMQIMEQKIIIKLSTTIILTGFAIAGFLAWFLQTIIIAKISY